ncbi:MAG: GAF domain-containing protein, partial [Anaerolineae bacterium]
FLAVRIDDTERKRTEEALRNIAQGVSATTGGAFFRSLVQYLARTLEVDYAFVGELAREKDESVRTIAVWAHGEMVANFEYHLAHTPCENVVGQRLCCYPHGVQQQFPRDHLLAEMEAESYIGTPLFDSAGRALGLMVVMDRQPLSNTKLAEAMLQIFAVRASAELERVWAEERLKAHARQQAAVADLGQRALAGIALSALMDEATAVVAQTLEVEYCKVLELLPDGDALLLRAGVGWQAGLVGQATVGAGTDSQAGYTLLSSEPVIVEDLRTETRFSGPPLLHDHGVVSGISVIIPGQDRPFGVLGAHTTRQRTFTRDDVHFLQAVANVLATAIKRRRTEAEIRRRNRELTLLNQVIAASAIAPSAEPEAVLETACRELALAFEVPQAAAALLNEEKTEAVVVAEYRAEGRPPALNETIPVKGNPSFQYLLGHKAPLVVADAQSDPRLAPVHDLMRQRGAVSLLILPLVIKGEVVGSLGLDAIEPRPFSAEEVEVAWTVADQAAGVLARTRLDRERRRLEEQYHQAQKMESVGRLAAGIAHDFNNLLTAINGFAALLQRELQPDDPRQESVSKILGSGQRAADLVRQLLAFSRKQVIEPKVLNLKTVVADMDKLLRRIIGEDIALEANCAPDLWPVQVDPAQMEQVIVNLAVNARDAMPEGGKLSIETSNVILDQGYARQHAEVSPGEYVLLAVSDTGVGMREEVKAHIFEPFFTTKEVSKGTGLGLATVFGIVKQSGGHIWVYSEEGQGATFKVYLPRAKETAPSLSGPVVGAEMPSGHETILLVEDDKGVRDLARRVLHTQGYTLLEAEDGQAALQLAARHAGPIHLLLTDVIMPGLSGKALAEQLAQTRPDLKILFISGYTDDAIAHHGVLVPGVALLPKPFSLIDLAHKVRAALDG